MAISMLSMWDITFNQKKKESSREHWDSPSTLRSSPYTLNLATNPCSP